MPSLTSFLPELAPILGLTRQALYERQRALVRLNLLPAPEKQGRSSGAVAAPDTIALLISAAMVTDNLSDTDERVKKLANAPYVDKKRDRCPWTGGRTFSEALTFLLSDRRQGRHAAVRVHRSGPSASIIFVGWPRPNKGTSEFGQRPSLSDKRLTVEAYLPNDALRSIRQALLSGDPDE